MRIDDGEIEDLLRRSGISALSMTSTASRYLRCVAFSDGSSWTRHSDRITKYERTVEEIMKDSGRRTTESGDMNEYNWAHRSI
jgi:hypothetical protein